MGTIKDILEKAYGKNASRESLVKDKSFKICESGEDIFYFESTFYVVKKNDNTTEKRVIWQNKTDFICKEIVNKTMNDEKSFIFLIREDDYPEYIFSVEICDIDCKKVGNVELINKSELDAALSNGNSIIRFSGLSKKNKIFFVAIKIGPENNRDYTALKHYIVSSDNRTYNKVVRNIIEYITVNEKVVPKNQVENMPHNLLVSGAPGTGKSHYLNKKLIESGESIKDEIIKNLPEQDKKSKTSQEQEEEAGNAYFKEYVTRVTFYEDYAYENFIGCYKPVPVEVEAQIKYGEKEGSIQENRITYKFVSGPFIDTYIKAQKDKEHNYFLIIEEINRAKAASVFGDMFQLLDRKNGESVYEIKAEAALGEYLKKNDCEDTMKLPSNMYIWATMNSADQGVMPLDSAFKRRWSSLYMDINVDEENARGVKISIGDGKNVLWENLRTKINDVILKNGFDEDRCIGSWYFSDEEINQINEYVNSSIEERKNAVNPLVDKLLYYLRQDVFRRNPSAMFKENDNNNGGITMSNIRKRIRENESINNILNIENLQIEQDKKETETNE